MKHNDKKEMTTEICAISQKAVNNWQTLNGHSPMGIEKLLKNAALNIGKTYLTLGWLARESRCRSNRVRRI